MTDGDRAALVGVWELVSWQFVRPDGTATDAFGPAPRGLLVYTAGGHMSVVITAGGREPLAVNPARRTLRERAVAFDGAHAYAGRWSLGDGEVIHHVQVSAVPNYEGSEQHRQLRLTGDQLTLTTPPGRAAHLTPGSSTVGRLIWRRVRH
jgi:hypothetical protein